MSLIKQIIFIIFLSVSLQAQGVMNAFSLGNFHHHQGIETGGDGVMKIVPSFDRGVSLLNPASWHKFKFTQLSISYGGDQNSWSNENSIHGYSGLKNAIWIIPLKAKGSLGLSLRPYSNQQVTINQPDSTNFIAFDDTLSLHKSFSRSGGISALKFASSILVNDQLSIGFGLDLLFGSTRQNESLFFDGSSIVQSGRTRYSGLIGGLYFGYEFSDKLNVYGSLTSTIEPLNALYTKRFLFDDANGNGYHDISFPYDFPSPDSVGIYDEVRYKQVHDPSGFAVGTSYSLSKNSSVGIEFSQTKENGLSHESYFMGLQDWVESSNQFNMSFNRYAKAFSLGFMDKFILRSGLTYKSHALALGDNSITEFGFSAGLGFKFRAVGNQIDLNYYFGKRDYITSYNDETIQQLQLSVSLADLWFVKRRQK